MDSQRLSHSALFSNMPPLSLHQNNFEASLSTAIQILKQEWHLLLHASTTCIQYTKANKAAINPIFSLSSLQCKVRLLDQLDQKLQHAQNEGLSLLFGCKISISTVLYKSHNGSHHPQYYSAVCNCKPIAVNYTNEQIGSIVILVTLKLDVRIKLGQCWWYWWVGALASLCYSSRQQHPHMTA